jgi:hypothetical protein
VAQSSAANMPHCIYVSVFARLVSSAPSSALELHQAEIIALVAVVRPTLREWLTHVVTAPLVEEAAFPNERFATRGYVGAKIYDAGIVSDFIAAFHGIEPWNVMHDENYFDELLAPGLTRPATAVLLTPEERAAYRKAHFGVK